MHNDIISPAYFGYLHLPSIWVDEAIESDHFRNASSEKVFEFVHSCTLNCGITVKARRDGFFLFDTHEWEPAAATLISQCNSNNGTKHRDVSSSTELAEQRSHVRAQLINAFQLCVHKARREILGIQTSLGPEVGAEDVTYFYSDAIPHKLNFHSESSPYQCFLAATHEQFFKREPKAIERRETLTIEALVYAYSVLEKTISNNYNASLRVVELIVRSIHRYSQNSMAESLIQSWTACELMLNYLWELYLNSKKGPAGTYERMNRGRIKKLTGRDFSVSSVTELLELSGQLDFDLMKNLHEVRTNRNAWLHSLKEITPQICGLSIKNATTLFKLVSDISFHTSLTRTLPGTGGVRADLYPRRTM